MATIRIEEPGEDRGVVGLATRASDDAEQVVGPPDPATIVHESGLLGHKLLYVFLPCWNLGRSCGMLTGHDVVPLGFEHRPLHVPGPLHQGRTLSCPAVPLKGPKLGALRPS